MLQNQQQPTGGLRRRPPLRLWGASDSGCRVACAREVWCQAYEYWGGDWGGVRSGYARCTLLPEPVNRLGVLPLPGAACWLKSAGPKALNAP